VRNSCTHNLKTFIVGGVYKPAIIVLRKTVCLVYTDSTYKNTSVTGYEMLRDFISKLLHRSQYFKVSNDL
jgi:hypothetical protein